MVEPRPSDQRTKPAATATGRYAQMHFVSGVAEQYERVYGQETYDTLIWKSELPFVRRVLEEVRARRGRLKYLDFACGTGRIIGSVEDLATESVGLDISPLMLAKATAHVRSELRSGDLLADPTVVDDDYDVITAFRFYLNTEPDVRLPIMRELASRLQDGDARLVFNIHGNRRSILSLTTLYRRLRGWPPLTLMSPPEVRRLVAAAGLEIVRTRRFGLLPRRLYRTRFRGLAAALDRAGDRMAVLNAFGQDAVYVCARQRRPNDAT